MRILGSLKRLIAKILMGFGYQIVKASANNYEEFVKISENTRVEHFKCDVRNGLENNIYMEIGSNSLVSGNYIFETLSGKITIGDNTFVGGGMFICIDGIEIGNDVMISWGCTFMDNDSHSLIWKERESDVRDWKQGVDEGSIGKYVNWQNVKREKIVVKDKAWIGFNSIILKGVTIGEGAVVGAGSVVTKDVPDFSVVAGNPARIIKYTT